MAAEIKGVKPKFSLLNHNIIHRMCNLMTINEKKHAGDHYQTKQINKKEYLDKIWRHLIDFLDGKVDDESGENPLIHLLCDAMILIDASEKQNIDTNHQNFDGDIVKEAIHNLKTLEENKSNE